MSGTLSLGQLEGARLDEAVRHYAEHGFLVLRDVEDAVTSTFRSVVAGVIGVEESRMEEVLDPANPDGSFSPEVRRRILKVTTSPELGARLLHVLGPLLLRLIGPLVQVSSTFHGQFKCDGQKAVAEGYGADPESMEVHNPVLLHQDFTGTSIPTSPSAVTLWVALNSCPYWNLRLYPGSHRLGLLCSKFLALEDRRLEPLGAPLDVRAEAGTALLFNALMLHGTCNPGPLRRASCDIRFFPLTGFLPSEVHLIGPRPLVPPRSDLDPVLRAPLLEDQAFLGTLEELPDAPPSSVLNWVGYVSHQASGEPEKARPHLERFANTEVGFEPPAAYVAKFQGKPVHEATLRQARGLVAGEPTG